ncbi:hypothetical protein QL285_062085 [Trifolium repens]|nr:hypothetical protein QL285_062085 [Trifolium repens]
MLKSSITGLSIFNNFCANVVVDGSTVNLGLQDIALLPGRLISGFMDCFAAPGCVSLAAVGFAVLSGFWVEDQLLSPWFVFGLSGSSFLAFSLRRFSITKNVLIFQEPCSPFQISSCLVHVSIFEYHLLAIVATWDKTASRSFIIIKVKLLQPLITLGLLRLTTAALLTRSRLVATIIVRFGCKRDPHECLVGF